MATDAYGGTYYNNNSNWFQVDWGMYDRAWPVTKKAVPPRQRRYLQFAKHSSESELQGRNLHEDGRVKSYHHKWPGCS